MNIIFEILSKKNMNDLLCNGYPLVITSCGSKKLFQSSKMFSSKK